jgi:hypothetical protein
VTQSSGIDVDQPFRRDSQKGSGHDPNPLGRE